LNESEAVCGKGVAATTGVLVTIGRLSTGVDTVPLIGSATSLLSTGTDTCVGRIGIETFRLSTGTELVAWIGTATDRLSTGTKPCAPGVPYGPLSVGIACAPCTTKPDIASTRLMTPRIRQLVWGWIGIFPPPVRVMAQPYEGPARTSLARTTEDV
jgi:hypothetical protein